MLKFKVIQRLYRFDKMLVTHHRIKHQLVLFTLIDAQLFRENSFTIRHMRIVNCDKR